MTRIQLLVGPLVAAVLLLHMTAAFSPSLSLVRSPRGALWRITVPPTIRAVEIETEQDVTTAINDNPQLEQPEPKIKQSRPMNDDYWTICSSPMYPQGRPLTPALERAMETNAHPQESQDELGRGISITADWRDNWKTYESPVDAPQLIRHESDGFACYELEDIEGQVPHDLVGVLYRNGPGKMGVGGERVQHTLDADALIYKIEFPKATNNNDNEERTIRFTSRFVETQSFRDEQQAGRFLYRGTFGTGPTSPLVDQKRPKNGLNADPPKPSLLAKVLGSAGNVNIKNSANTQIVSFGGKLLALFEAGLPHALNPKTLETIGEDTLGGILEEGLPVKLPNHVPTPSFIGGSAHTAHPQVCPTTGHLVGWHWSAMVANNSELRLTFTEYSPENFQPIASKTFDVPGCALAPHDMAMTSDKIILNVNALTMNQLPFLLGVKGPAESLAMDGRANIQTWVFPRPTATQQFEPFCVQTPPCFCIHHSHAYQDEVTGNLVTFFTGWPPSDSKDFLGAWGGFAPEFHRIPVTYLWRHEMDLTTKTTVSLEIAPGSANACIEHVLCHPNFTTQKANYVYGTISNVVGDSTPPNGYARLRVETGKRQILPEGEVNDEIEAYWFGTRYFTTEPLIVPKDGGDINNERQAYLVGVVRDAVAERNFVAIFDLEQDLQLGPVCKIWLKSGVPHGLHGCFAKDDSGGPSTFC